MVAQQSIHLLKGPIKGKAPVDMFILIVVATQHHRIQQTPGTNLPTDTSCTVHLFYPYALFTFSEYYLYFLCQQRPATILSYVCKYVDDVDIGKPEKSIIYICSRLYPPQSRCH